MMISHHDPVTYGWHSGNQAGALADIAARQSVAMGDVDALEVSRSLALAARRQHVDRVLQAMSGVSSAGRPEQLAASNVFRPEATPCKRLDTGVDSVLPATTLHPSSFQTPAHRQAQQERRREARATDIHNTASAHRQHRRHVAYPVPGSPDVADYSQSQTVTEFLRSCHSISHGAEAQAMPPLPPDVGSSMEKLLLDQICQLCKTQALHGGAVTLQERAALVAKQQRSEQLIKHLEERVTYLEDCLDQSASAHMDHDALTEG